MAGLRRHTRFYPFFHFYFFIFYNHLAILDYEARPISSCIPLSFCIHNQALAFGELAERRSVQQKKKKIPERNSLYSPRIADHVLLVWTTGQQWANGKRPPDPPFSYILSGARGLCYALIQLFYSNKEGWRHRRTSYNILEQEGGGEQGNGMGWAGLDWRRAFWERERLSRTLSWVDHGPPAFGHFFIFFELFGQQEKGRETNGKREFFE